MRVNLPNQITLSRLVLAVVFFALLSFFSAQNLEDERWVLVVCFVVFLVAAATDIVDGLLARMMNQVTSFGRIVDPVVDKVMICGAFVYFASPIFWDPTAQENITGVEPWMVVVILVRELLVSAIRSHSESLGQDFSAMWIGKLKLVIQATTACVILGVIGFELKSLEPLRIACVWLTVIVTAFSIVSYVRRAHAFLLSHSALGASAPPPPADSDRAGETGLQDATAEGSEGTSV